MRRSTSLNTAKNNRYIVIGVIILITLFLCSLFIGRFPLSLSKMLEGDEFQIKIFWTLRFSRVLVGFIGGFALGMAGFVFQILFRNSLASPDIIGVSSGASAGAALGILFFPSAIAVMLCSFSGALIAVILAIFFSSLDRSDRKGTIILAGIAVHSLAQTFLMILKTIADPERQLASIEYWIMGSLNGVNSHAISSNLVLCLICLSILVVFNRQTLLLSQDEAEAKLLGVDVYKMRFIILILTTLTVSSVVSLTGLISFVGLLAPHSARRLTNDNSVKTFILSGIIGGIILLIADILARSVSQTELPVSIFTSLIGAPFLVFLIFRGRDRI
ncbi:MAG: iron ABC transporter permease [Lachnospiraceae bacterium]|nr:iron ABC transporter permease [Lachnospiraceae bacterium]